MWKWQFHEAMWIQFRTPREIFISFRSPGGQMRFRTRKIISLCVPLGLHDFKAREMLHCSTWETRFRTREICYISLSVPHVQHAFERGKYTSEGVFPHMQHAFDQVKYTSVYKILLSTPVSTPLAQHNFRTGEIYIAFHSTRVTSWTMQ